MTRATPITGPSRVAIAELIGRLAAAGLDDPTIAARLGIKPRQVAGIRKDFGIEPGHRP
ncbi:hypothetical protein [Umezawaea tangerina]|uniref:Homeodomain-like domain-containing protein n=1 Tax=Umezawaea tangerina TaxID=84725 RepID=A0A2T0SPE3_9PSEU|nr:hypothetical protein [Umezawaea tangerina]PRY35291.1 hypothetical protein CLV43_114209 [Umezawaea tangerina]